MIGLEEVPACSAVSAVEGIGSCRARSASEIADATGNHLPHLLSYEELLNRNAVSIVGENESRCGRNESMGENGEVSVMGADSNREALLIGDLITALENKFRFGRK